MARSFRTANVLLDDYSQRKTVFHRQIARRVRHGESFLHDEKDDRSISLPFFSSKGILIRKSMLIEMTELRRKKKSSVFSLLFRMSKWALLNRLHRPKWPVLLD